MLRDFYIPAVIFALFMSPAFADEGANPVSSSYCSRLITAVKGVRSTDALLDRLDEVSQFFLTVREDLPAGTAEQLLEELNLITDQTLGAEENSHAVRTQMEAWLKKVLEFLTAKRESEKTPGTISELISAPNQISAETRYLTSTPNLTVVFDASFIQESAKLAEDSLVNLLKAIDNGFVQPRRKSGIVRPTEIHKSLAIVRSFSNQLHAIGCLRGGVLRLKQIVRMRGQTNSGSFSVYASTCRE